MDDALFCGGILACVKVVALCLAVLVAVSAGFVLTADGATPTPGATRSAHRARHRHARPLLVVHAQITVSPDAARTAVPPSYLGLSTEYWALPFWSGEMPVLERALALVHVRGDGPLVLRVGGDSADHTFWDPNEAPMPDWAFSLAPKWLDQARALVRTLGVRLILDLNLITDTPGAAGQWARAAEAGLPPHSIEAFEVGNEPDIYSRADWLAIVAGRGLDSRVVGRVDGARGGRVGRLGRVGRDRFSATALPAALTAYDYARDFRAYARVLEAVAPRAMLAGPALANPLPHGRWVPTLIDHARRDLGMITIHRYPYTGCPRRRGTPSFATIGRVLSPAASTGLAAALQPLVDDAHDAGLPLRLTELNSVNCGGLGGVSDAFATALWAPDALFSLMRRGVDGVNLHVRADASTHLSPSDRAASRPGRCSTDSSCLRAPSARTLSWSGCAPISAGPRTSRRGRSASAATTSACCSSTRAAAPARIAAPARAGAARVQRLLAPSAAVAVRRHARRARAGRRWALAGLLARQTLAPRGAPTR